MIGSVHPQGRKCTKTKRRIDSCTQGNPWTVHGAFCTMDTADPELLGSIFKTLSIVFKYLSKELLADMKRVKILYFGLLTNKKEHVQSFAAESWAFLLRKLKGKALRTQCRNILSSVRPVAANTPTLAGVGLVIFELVKSVQYQLHSNTADVMKAVVSSIRPSSESSSSSAKRS